MRVGLRYFLRTDSRNHSSSRRQAYGSGWLQRAGGCLSAWQWQGCRECARDSTAWGARQSGLGERDGRHPHRHSRCNLQLHSPVDFKLTLDGDIIVTWASSFLESPTVGGTDGRSCYKMHSRCRSFVGHKEYDAAALGIWSKLVFISMKWILKMSTK